MKIFVQFPRKDIFSFKCKYCFNILSKAHDARKYLWLEAESSNDFPLIIGRETLCDAALCLDTRTRGHAGTRDTGPLFSWVC